MSVTDSDSPENSTANAVECDALLSDVIEQIAPYDWQLSAKQAVDKIPPDQLADAWHWAATYLVELRARISTDNRGNRNSPGIGQETETKRES